MFCESRINYTVLYGINNSDNNLWCVSFYSLITCKSASLNGFSANKTSSYFTVLRFLKIRNWIKPKIVTAKKIIIQTTISEVTYAGLRNCLTICYWKLINFSDFGDRMKILMPSSWWHLWKMLVQLCGITSKLSPTYFVSNIHVIQPWRHYIEQFPGNNKSENHKTK